MGLNLFNPPSEHEFLAHKDKIHQQNMLNARKRDEELSDFPYIDHIPFPFSYVTRQSNDIMETYFMKAIVLTPIFGYCAAMLKYGGA